MARRDSLPDSPLSSISPDEEFDDDMTDDLPPSKRQKLFDGASAPAVLVPVEDEPEAEADSASAFAHLSDISSDTDGDIPSSPVNARQEDDDAQEQVTTCAWDGCAAGDMETMDQLVEHIHNDHIEGKQKKYTCEWIGCARKSLPHASGYALKAHMRSHTREKPFYCYLPECDRAFTRSDALAKHMRTVHETEALRPSDPVPKSMQSGGGSTKSGKVSRIVVKQQAQNSAQDEFGDDDGQSDDISEHFTPLTAEHGFTQRELAMPLKKLHGLCRMQVKWAESDGEELKIQAKQWDELYQREWLEKEVLLSQVIKQELEWHQLRQAVVNGEADVQIGPDVVISSPGGQADRDKPIPSVTASDSLVFR